MKEYLELFTQITEALPAEKTQGFAWRHDRVLAGLFVINKNGVPCIDIGGGYWEPYTHWLDLSKITTKERAMQALCTTMRYETDNEIGDSLYIIDESKFEKLL